MSGWPHSVSSSPTANVRERESTGWHPARWCQGHSVSVSSSPQLGLRAPRLPHFCPPGKVPEAGGGSGAFQTFLPNGRSAPHSKGGTGDRPCQRVVIARAGDIRFIMRTHIESFKPADHFRAKPCGADLPASTSEVSTEPPGAPGSLE